MKPITVIGGGLAGLALGILLRRENAPVIVYEAGRYPRHRVCGEFLSGAGKQIFSDLGVQVRSRNAKSAQFFSGNKSVELALSEPALCASRFELDAALARELERCGGELRVGERFLQKDAEGVVHASGRRRAEPGQGHLFGLKAHATGANLKADLEFHFGPKHYVGLCNVEADRVNVCGLFFSEQPLREIQEKWPEILGGAVHSHALANARWDDESFCAVAGLTLDRSNPVNEFCIGDAAAMIPPLTGNGMSMAFESAQLAAPLLERFSAGKLMWSEALAKHGAIWRTRFASRLRWAGFVQRMAFHSSGRRIIFQMSRMFPSVPRLFFARTR